MSSPIMPKTRFQSIAFTAITAWIMVYIMTYCQNFILAFPVQLLPAGPIARNIFRVLFGRGNRPEEQKIEDEMLAAGPLPTPENPNPASFNTLVDAKPASGTAPEQ